MLDNTLADSCIYVDSRRRNYNKYMNECYRLRLIVPHDTGNEEYVSDIVQAGQRVLDAMVGEGKLQRGAQFIEDKGNPASGDSAWFIIQADDNDSLEKIYLHYQFRYSQES